MMNVTDFIGVGGMILTLVIFFLIFRGIVRAVFAALKSLPARERSTARTDSHQAPPTPRNSYSRRTPGKKAKDLAREQKHVPTVRRMR